ncbi:cellulose biosynthesis cyclic di-GMP-binding regulatory protein BcsB [Allorhizobium undicola]|uniref:cellulose biosynthesis cyclic di-GMP-binding regulatory protein BcsB n=1 Tax=Allorhizobium undicola TaxID=78527 RepID=UPI003D325A7F
MASAQAEDMPFDMSPERQQQNVQTPQSLPPRAAPPASQGANTQTGTPATGLAPARSGSDPARTLRYAIPESDLTLAGEYDRRSWSIYLTPDQAGAPAHFVLSYQNAVVVAPEASTLTVMVNNRPVGETAIRSSANASTLRFDIPAGLLRPGANSLTFIASQRHRTDCDLQSTYELWTRLSSKGTYFEFAASSDNRINAADVLRSIGVDGEGHTTLSFLVPGLGQPGTTRPVLTLAQGLSVLPAMPNIRVEFSRDSLPASRPGNMVIAVGTPEELAPVFPALPASIQNSAGASYVNDPASGRPILVLSGPSWSAISSAADALVNTYRRSDSNSRDMLATSRWSEPDAPMLSGPRRLRLSELGVSSVEFSGSRYRTGFNIAVPADFYANAYGEAKIMMDAAYTAAVGPGSHIDVYVNDRIATTVPITAAGGGLLNHFPVRVTLRHLKPGLNRITLEANLLNRADAVCAPGNAAKAPARFALFDTSEFVMPEFARIGRSPNLAALAGTGWPYSEAPEPIALYLDRADAQTLGAAGTFLARLAIAAGEPLRFEIASTPQAVGERDAIFIGSIGQMPGRVLAQVGVSAESISNWKSSSALSRGGAEGVRLDDWRSKITDNLIRAKLRAIEAWMQRNFDISSTTFHLLPGSQRDFTPGTLDTFLIAQGPSPEGSHHWTMVSAPDAADLDNGMQAVAGLSDWDRLNGAIMTYSSRSGAIETRPGVSEKLETPTDVSLGNMRLIAANWLSSNILFYAFALVLLAMLCGALMAFLLRRLGRST